MRADRLARPVTRVTWLAFFAAFGPQAFASTTIWAVALALCTLYAATWSHHAAATVKEA